MSFPDFPWTCLPHWESENEQLVPSYPIFGCILMTVPHVPDAEGHGVSMRHITLDPLKLQFRESHGPLLLQLTPPMTKSI